ncbi:hypothetical protein C6Q17_03585 [Burkholderia contaminans]|nr:hypothetical protein C6Q17_03585 [Burkholderia contaminans]
MSSGLVVIELKGNARLREPRRSRFDATRRQAGHVDKRSIRPSVRRVVHDDRARYRTGWRPTHKRNDRRTSSVREFTPRFEMVLLPKDNPESAGYAAGRPARYTFGYQDLILSQQSRQSVPNTTFPPDRPPRLRVIFTAIL